MVDRMVERMIGWTVDQMVVNLVADWAVKMVGLRAGLTGGSKDELLVGTSGDQKVVAKAAVTADMMVGMLAARLAAKTVVKMVAQLVDELVGKTVATTAE